MMYTEACPHCGDENYEITDYGDNFDTYSGSQWWACTCSKCGHKFEITKIYNLAEVTIEEVSGS